MAKILVALALCVPFSQAGKSASLSYSSGGGTDLPFGLNPTAEGSYSFDAFDLPVDVTVSGAYELSKNKFSPSKLTVALGKKVGEVGVKALLTALPPYDSPGLAAEATVSTEYGSVTFDSSDPKPKLVEGAPISFMLAKLRPKWNPRVEGQQGLSLDVDCPFSKGNDRATVSATFVPEARPEVSFHFGLVDGSVDITPLLGEGAKATKFEYEKTGLPHGASAKVTLLGNAVTLGAKVPTPAGVVTPTVVLDASKLGAAPKLSLKQSYAL
jgi:hypothetical protein